MQDPAKRGALCSFQKIYSSIFSELDTFCVQAPLGGRRSTTEKWVWDIYAHPFHFTPSQTPFLTMVSDERFSDQNKRAGK